MVRNASPMARWLEASAQVETFDDELRAEFIGPGVATYPAVAPEPDDEIDASHLSLLVETRELEHISGLMEIPQLREATTQFERKYIHRSLLRNKWDIAKTAADLGVADADLQGKIRSLNITFVE